MKQGFNGAHISAYQEMLARAGLYSGAVDGSFGPLTDRATRKFQGWLGVKQDGHYGPVSRVSALAQLAAINTPESLATDPVIPWLADWNPDGQ